MKYNIYIYILRSSIYNISLLMSHTHMYVSTYVFVEFESIACVCACVYVCTCMYMCTRDGCVYVCGCARVCVCEALSYFTMVLVDKLAGDALACVSVRLLICCI